MLNIAPITGGWIRDGSPIVEQSYLWKKTTFRGALTLPDFFLWLFRVRCWCWCCWLNDAILEAAYKYTPKRQQISVAEHARCAVCRLMSYWITSPRSDTRAALRCICPARVVRFRWRDMTMLFNFPPDCTRKFCLLHYLRFRHLRIAVVQRLET